MFFGINDTRWWYFSKLCLVYGYFPGIGPTIAHALWMYIKIGSVALLWVFHFICTKYLLDFNTTAIHIRTNFTAGLTKFRRCY